MLLKLHIYIYDIFIAIFITNNNCLSDKPRPFVLLFAWIIIPCVAFLFLICHGDGDGERESESQVGRQPEALQLSVIMMKRHDEDS